MAKFLILLVGVPLLAALAVIPYARSVGCTEMTAQWEASRPFVTIGLVILALLVLKTPSRAPQLHGRAGLAVMNLGLFVGLFTVIAIVAGLTWIFQTLDVGRTYLSLIGC